MDKSVNAIWPTQTPEMTQLEVINQMMENQQQQLEEATQSIPPTGGNMLYTLRWATETNAQLKEPPCEVNWCNSKQKCYYAGSMPNVPNYAPKLFAQHFITSVLSKIEWSDNPNKPAISSFNTNSFFVIVMDYRNTNDIKPHFFHYDGIKSLKTSKKGKVYLHEFGIEDIEVGHTKPWNKIDKIKFDMTQRELKDIFTKFSVKVKEEMIKTNEQQSNEHVCEDHCEECDPVPAESAGDEQPDN